MYNMGNVHIQFYRKFSLKSFCKSYSIYDKYTFEKNLCENLFPFPFLGVKKFPNILYRSIKLGPKIYATATIKRVILIEKLPY